MHLQNGWTQMFFAIIKNIIVYTNLVEENMLLQAAMFDIPKIGPHMNL